MTTATADQVAEHTAKIAHALVGTAEAIQYVIARLDLDHLYDNETDLDTALFDSIVFCCTCCEWWCGADEINDDPETGQWICDDCAADQD